MQYIASLSYGKDSLYMLEIIKQNNLPLDRIVHVEIMATSTIPADLPEMMEFKKHADEIIKQKYGIAVEHLHAPHSYEDYFYRKRGKRAKKENQGKIYGFPVRMSPWCNDRLKVRVLKQFDKKDITQYIGIAVEETQRYHNLSATKISPLVEYNVSEKQCYEWCEQNGLLSPIYKHTSRGGCWFCHNQRLAELKHLRANYPEYWALMLKWDLDSPVSFKADGKTIHDLDKRFKEEDKQVTIF